jgi:hypothetical protein
MSLIQNHFWGNVLRCPADGKGPSLSEELGETKVCEFEVAIVANQQVFGFEVAKDDVFAMEIFETRGDCGSIKASLVCGKRLHVAQVSEEFTTVDEFEDQVKILGILGKAFEGDDEGVCDL